MNVFTVSGRTRIKFCGITRAEDAEAAVALGVDLLGFVLVPASPRAIDPAEAERIRRRLPPGVASVALFKDATAQALQDALAVFAPDWLQFHGSEDAAQCDAAGRPYLKALAMGQSLDLLAAAATFPSAHALLLDGHAPGAMGGSGQTFDWQRAQTALGRPVFVAGGLHPANVAAAIAQAQPYGVDVSSGIETAPGIKDYGKMADFVTAVREADARRTAFASNRP